MQNGAVSTVVSESGSFGPHYRYRVFYRLVRGLPYIRIQLCLTAHFRDGEAGAPETIGEGEGKAGLTLRLAGERNKAVCTRYQPFLTWPYDLTMNPIFGAPYWTDISDGRAGVAWLNKGDIGYRYNREEHRLDNILAYGRVGELRWDVGVLAHDGDCLTGDVHRWGLNFGNPLHACYVSGHAGLMPARGQLCAVAPDTVTVSSAFRSGGHNYLRLYDHAGRPAEVRVTQNNRSLPVKQVNLRLQPAAPANGVMLGPHRIATIALP
jgi:hypothetical protein